LRVFKRSGITIRWAISCLSLAIPRHARATCNIQIRVDTNFRDAGAIARGASLGAILGGQRRCLSSCASASKTAARVDEPLPVPAGYQLRQNKAVAEAKSKVTVSPARYLGCRGQRDRLATAHRAGRRVLLRFNKRVGHGCILFNPVLGYCAEALTKLPVPCHIKFEIKAESHRPTPANQARESCASPHPAKARALAV